VPPFVFSTAAVILINVDIMYNPQGAIKGGWHDRKMRSLAQNIVGSLVATGIIAVLTYAAHRAFAHLDWPWLVVFAVVLAVCAAGAIWVFVHRLEDGSDPTRTFDFGEIEGGVIEDVESSADEVLRARKLKRPTIRKIRHRPSEPPKNGGTL
jgi:fumarate reductase subunit D